jgi:CheY-like chemotaxis protein
MLRVRDSGVGIPQSMLDQVFDLFSQVTPSFTQSRGGLGIGLSLVRALVDMHGGAVTAHSDGLGKGSEFTVQLPLLDRRAAPISDGSVDAKARAGTGLRLVVVDDNADSVDALGMWLRLEGHEVEVAYSGEEALPLALERRPHAVLLDLALPGIDGYEVARRLRREPGFERVCLIAMTGFGAYADRERAKQAGFDHHIVKPIDYAVFARLLGQLNPGAESSPLRVQMRAVG